MAENERKKNIKFAPQYLAEVANFPYTYQPGDPYDERPISRREVRDRYAQMYRNEQDRAERTYVRVQDPQNRFYAGVDPRRRQEVADGGMVQEDHRAMANLSRTAIHHEYPKSEYYATPYDADTVRSLNLAFTEPEEGY